MKVVRVDAAHRLALCTDPQGEQHTVEIELVDPVSPGDRLLVHASVALVAI